MGYQYPFWLENRAKFAESNATSYAQQLEQCREKLRHVTCPHTPHVDNLVQTQISKLNGVFNTDTYVPLESIKKNQ